MTKYFSNKLPAAIADLRATLALLPAVFFLTWSDTKARYQRSVLGPFWLVLGTMIGVAGLGFLWSTLLHSDRATFIPSLTVGLIVWQFISGCVTEGSAVFVRSSSVIRNLKIPFFFHALQTVMRQFINFTHNIVVIVVIFIIYPPHLSYAQMLVIPGLILLVCNLLWITMLIGMLGARYRDLEYLINSIMPLLFFLSPVIYRPENLGMKSHIVWLNPFTYLIAVVRDPLQGIASSCSVYIVSVLMLLVGGVFTLWLLDRKYKRIAFWV
jgi:ABC-type polysaccharide/polyol phosphate export permease